ncbi:MAG: porin [Elusimicrobia bacterium]|nr:porin [Elusimicrobiota bacterium]
MIKRHVGVGWGVLLLLGGVAGRTEEMNDRFLALEARQKALEDKLAAQPVVTAGKDGFALKSADGAFALKFFGDVQVDGRFYLDDDANKYTDKILLRRLRPTFEMVGFNKLTARLQPNFGGTGTSFSLDDAYLDYKASSLATFRAGRYKPPVGLENLQSSVRTTFIERSLATNLVPVYDVGAQLHGGVVEGKINYAISVSNGAPDGEVVATDSADGKEVSGRLFVQPMKGSKSIWGELGLGISASTAREFGTNSAPKLPAGFKTEGQENFFKYRYAVAQGAHQRVSPQILWYVGSLGFMGEHVSSYQTVRATATATNVNMLNQAWQLAFSYVLTGESPSYKGLKPAKNFDPAKNEWGALELAGRVSRFTVDDDAFDYSIADTTDYAREARAWTGGINWYPNAFFKIMANYTYTGFSGGAASGDRRPERALFLRTQVAF